MSWRLDGRVAVVTGGHHGIGLATTRSFLEAGASVGVVGRSTEHLDEAKNELGSERSRITFVKADVTDEAEVSRAFAEVESTLGAATILVCNAGVNDPPVHVVDMTLEQWERSFRNNATSVFLSARAALPAMLAARYGRIIALSSRAAFAGGILRVSDQEGSAAHYAAGKAAIVGFTRALAMELAGSGVTANVVAPGPIGTPRYRERLQRLVPTIPVGRLGDAADVADAIVYLAADRGFVTGQVLHVNGGTWLL